MEHLENQFVFLSNFQNCDLNYTEVFQKEVAIIPNLSLGCLSYTRITRNFLWSSLGRTLGTRFSFLWLLHHVFLKSWCHLISRDLRGKTEGLLVSNETMITESYDSNVRFEISMSGVWDCCFSPTKHTLLLWKDVFPFQVGRNDIGSTLSSSWSSLLLCQRARRVGKQDCSVWNRLCSFKSLTLNQFFTFPLLFSNRVLCSFVM